MTLLNLSHISLLYALQMLGLLQQGTPCWRFHFRELEKEILKFQMFSALENYEFSWTNVATLCRYNIMGYIHLDNTVSMKTDSRWFKSIISSGG